MGKWQLQPEGRTQLKKASRDTIGDYFSSLPLRERKLKWIRKTNRYRKNCISVYGDDTSTKSVKHKKIVEYIASSGPSHAIDGWSFFGRAIQALFHGDAYSAIHLGYYAELRGAMALLACEGVGILKNNHPIVLSGDRTIRLPKCREKTVNRTTSKYAHTHKVIAPCLKSWSRLDAAANLLDRVVKPASRPLSDWLTSLGAPAKRKAVASSWLSAWGLDLAQIDTDHDARNLVSYRPSEFRLPTIIGWDELSRFVSDLWTLFEPSSACCFSILEMYLLRLALRKSGVAPPDKITLHNRLGLGEIEAGFWEAALARSDVPIPLREAHRVSSIENKYCPIQVISRAGLLLFLATRSASLHLLDAGYSRSELGFWWQRYGSARGVFSGEDIPEDPRDIWADVRERLDTVMAAIATDPPRSLFELRKRFGANLHELGAWELVALWGLVP